jgi:hypothetical protein
MTMAPQDLFEVGEEILEWKDITVMNGNGRNGGNPQKIKEVHRHPAIKPPKDYYERVFVEQGITEAWNLAATNARILQQKLEARNSQLAQLRKTALALLNATVDRRHRLEWRMLGLTRKQREEKKARQALMEVIKTIPGNYLHFET